MGWAAAHIEALRRGETVRFRPTGNSMTPRIRSGQLCTVEPVTLDDVRGGDVVLCRVGRAEYLHVVLAVVRRQDAASAQIGNAHGRVNGWTSEVFGRLVRVED